MNLEPKPFSDFQMTQSQFQTFASWQPHCLVNSECRKAAGCRTESHLIPSAEERATISAAKGQRQSSSLLAHKLGLRHESDGWKGEFNGNHIRNFDLIWICFARMPTSLQLIHSLYGWSLRDQLRSNCHPRFLAPNFASLYSAYMYICKTERCWCSSYHFVATNATENW